MCELVLTNVSSKKSEKKNKLQVKPWRTFHVISPIYGGVIEIMIFLKIYHLSSILVEDMKSDSLRPNTQSELRDSKDVSLFQALPCFPKCSHLQKEVNFYHKKTRLS